MKIKSIATARKANKALSKARIVPFKNLGLPPALIKEIQAEFENCFAQGVLFERHNSNWQEMF